MSATACLPPTPTWPARARLRAALLVTAAVLLLHSLALSLVDKAPGRGWAAQAARAVNVRRVVVPAHAAAARVASPVAAPVATPADVPQESLPPSRPSARAPSANLRATQAPVAVQMAAPAAVEPQPEPAPAPETGGLQVPVYATHPPASTLLRFESRRGISTGVAELGWRHSADGYQLSLQGQALGAPFIGWSSVGTLDSAGLAPLRLAESRRGRDVRAANFLRDSGLVTFSGPQVEHPLVPGMQDRLSWLVQLPAILQANPALALPGAQVQLAVVGTRGDAEVWTFTVQGRGPLDLPEGPVADAVHLLREPRRPYDTQVQVWLDPARQHLPVQAWLRVRATGEGTELRLLEMAAP